MSFKDKVEAIVKENSEEVANVSKNGGAEYNIILKKDDPETAELKKDIRTFVNEAMRSFKLKMRAEMQEWKKRTAGYEAEEIDQPVENYIQMTIDDEPDTFIINVRTDDDAIAARFKEQFGQRIEKAGFIDTF